MKLQFGETGHQELSAGQSRCFKVDVGQEHQYVQVLIRQNGIDVETSLFDPAGDFLELWDTTTGTKGDEPLSFIAEKKGEYVLVVDAPVTPDQAPPETNASALSFDIKFAQSRPASVRDSLLVSAEWNFHAGDVMRVSEDINQFPCAVTKFQRALDSYASLGDINGETQSRNHLGFSLIKLQRYKESFDYLLPAIGVWPSLGKPFREGEAYNNLGFAYEMMGDIDSAVVAYEKALTLYKEARAVTKDGEGVADINRAETYTIINISDLYIKINQPDKAISNLKPQVDLPYVAGNPDVAPVIIRDIGRAYVSKGEYKNALNQFNLALASIPKNAPGFAQLRASILNSKGVMLIYLGEYSEGLVSFNEALDLYGENAYGKAAVYNSLGGTYAAKDEKGKQIALGYYWKALDLLDGLDGAKRTFEVRQATADTLYNLAVAQRELGQLDAAKDSIEESIAYIEFLRATTGQQENRESIFSGKHFYYEFYTDLLRRLHKARPNAGYDTEALLASERARGRSLLDLLIKAEVPAPTSVPDELVRRVADAQNRLTDAMRRRRRALHADGADAPKTELKSEVDDREKDYKALGEELKKSGDSSLLVPYSIDLEQIKSLLGSDTVLLEYEVGTQKSLLWIVTGEQMGSPITVELPGREALEKLVRAYRDAITARGCYVKNEFEDERRARIARADKAYPGAADSLSDALLGPAATYLGSKRLAVVASEALQFVPFGALPDPTFKSTKRGLNKTGVEGPGTPLVVNHEIVFLPSASALAEMRSVAARRSEAPKLIAALANPVVEPGDKRITKRAGGGLGKPSVGKSNVETAQRLLRGPNCTSSDEFTSLPGTHGEVQRISGLIPDERMKLIAEGFSASLATMESPLLRDYRIIHLATHAYIPAGSPASASIVFSLFDEAGKQVPGHLWLSDIYGLKINADLVTLSACETGIGREILGEGLVGLSRGFMYAGAPRVVASLWKVDDDATSKLMSDFYSAMWTKNMSPSAALQEAQRDMLQTQDKAEWKFPFYWAAFTLQGEWLDMPRPRDGFSRAVE
jgi:CHAT domain-containing protein/tetratricopeptide (TPR) repeat protein